ncbi:heparinase [Actinoplanes capillaceus]|uniref:Heparinase n=1 Tax=Actinoplanes campanulatus TaxID=113559 RepID=A0ABQ3WY37_9ACTN|nr:heparinase II/III family protein [Actinoplanes capillaceus]GID51137.1 heparinase [Actinoplanes capillaceus]
MRVPSADDRDAWTAVDAATLQALTERARATLGTPWPTPLAHDFARFYRDGDRDTYEQAVWARHERLARATALAAVTLDPVWLDEVTDGAVLFCEQSTWCWPGHDDMHARHGSVLPVVTDPCVDLGAGEVAADLAWIDHVLGGHLDGHVPGLRARIRHEVDRRVLTPFTERRDWHWLGLDGRVHNWNPWIHSNVLIATLALVDDPARRQRLIGLITEGLDRFGAALPADGAIDEGVHYWWYGACRYLEALEMLGATTAKPGVVAFPHRVHLGGPWYVNHADGPARPSYEQPWHVLHRLARLYGDKEAEAHAAAHRRPGEPVAHEGPGLGYLLLALTDRDWAAVRPGGSPLPRDVWFPSTQVLVARSEAGGSAGLTLAVKGGHNDENHNHNDVGSFIVARDGAPVLVDPGRPTYTAQTFGPHRYEIWTMRSTWHNTPTIRGVEQAAGRAFAAQNVVAGDASLTMDLAAAYPRDDVLSWIRVARLDRATGTVTVRDSWELAPGPADPTVIHLVVAGDVTVSEGRAEAGGLVITWASVEADDPAAKPPNADDGPANADTGPTGAGDGPADPGPARADDGRANADTGPTRADDGPANTHTGPVEPGVRRGGSSPGLPCTIVVRELDDPVLSDVWGDRLTRLDIDVTALGPVGTLELTVKETR